MAKTTIAIELRAGESLAVSGPAAIRLESKSGGVARLSVTADEGVRIDRPQRQKSGAEQARMGVFPRQ